MKPCHSFCVYVCLCIAAACPLGSCSSPPGGGGGGGSSDGSGECLAAGANCTEADACCAALACILDTCQPEPVTDDFLADCAGAGEGCATSDDCCLGLACSGGLCGEFADDFETFDVTYQEGGRVISEAALAEGLIAVSADRAEYRFAAGAAELEELGPGDVVLFSGLSVRRVTGITDDAGDRVITTEPAALTDLIRDGAIAWQHTIDVEDLPSPRVDPEFADLFVLNEGSAEAARPTNSKWGTAAQAMSWSGTINGWDTTFRLEPADLRLNVELNFTRSVNGMPVVTLNGKGWVGKFQQRTRLVIRDGRLMHAEAWTQELRGEMEITWSAVNRGAFIETDHMVLQVPVSFDYPTLVGPIPVVLSLKATGRLNAQLRVSNTASRGQMRVRYGGSQGFTIEDTSDEGEGAAGLPDCSAENAGTDGMDVDEGEADDSADGGPQCIGEDTSFAREGGASSTQFDITGDTITVGAVTVGLGAGIEFPRLEVALAGTVSAFVSVDTAVSGFFEPGLPGLSAGQSCHWSELVIRGIAGYDLSILGHELLSGSEELWREEFKRFSAGSEAGCDEASAESSD